jgi:hypothetical protein
MMGRRIRAKRMRSVREIMFAAVVLAIYAPAAHASLTDALGPSSGTLVAAPFVFELQRTISRATDFPATTTTPGFTYHYDPVLVSFERSSTSLGPAFLERADTVGQGRFDLGMSYLYADFVEKDGEDLDGLTEGLLFRNLGILDGATVTFTKFDLTVQALYFSGTYGITDRWDVNLLVPLFHTSLDVDQRLTTLTFGTQRSSSSDDATGPGDLQLRTKYLLGRGDQLRYAAGFALRVPSGDEDDFQGIGDVTLTPSGVVSYLFGSNDAHLSLGFETNADDLERSRVAYGTGVSLGLHERLTVNVDIIGTSQFVDDDITIHVADRPQDVAEGARRFGSDVAIVPSDGGTDLITTIDRMDTVDVTVGFKVNVYKTAVLFGSAIVPLTSDGIQADVIPAGGVEVSF